MTLRFLWALAALPLFVAQANAQASIKAFSGVIEGHEVGGLSIDMVGDV